MPLNTMPTKSLVTLASAAMLACNPDHPGGLRFLTPDEQELVEQAAIDLGPVIEIMKGTAERAESPHLLITADGTPGVGAYDDDLAGTYDLLLQVVEDKEVFAFHRDMSSGILAQAGGYNSENIPVAIDPIFFQMIEEQPEDYYAQARLMVYLLHEAGHAYSGLGHSKEYVDLVYEQQLYVNSPQVMKFVLSEHRDFATQLDYHQESLGIMLMMTYRYAENSAELAMSGYDRCLSGEAPNETLEYLKAKYAVPLTVDAMWDQIMFSDNPYGDYEQLVGIDIDDIREAWEVSGYPAYLQRHSELFAEFDRWVEAQTPKEGSESTAENETQDRVRRQPLR